MKIPMAGKMVNINTTLQLYCTCNFYLATQVYHGYMSCRFPVLVTNKLYCSNCGVFYYEGEVTTCFFSPSISQQRTTVTIYNNFSLSDYKT